jgi:hypothetical protein
VGAVPACGARGCAFRCLRSRLCQLRRRVGLGGGLVQLGERQLELLKGPAPFLGVSKLLVARLGGRVPQEHASVHLASWPPYYQFSA